MDFRQKVRNQLAFQCSYGVILVTFIRLRAHFLCQPRYFLCLAIVLCIYSYQYYMQSIQYYTYKDTQLRAFYYQLYLLLVLLMDKDIVIVRISKDFNCAITPQLILARIISLNIVTFIKKQHLSLVFTTFSYLLLLVYTYNTKGIYLPLLVLYTWRPIY